MHVELGKQVTSFAADYHRTGVVDQNRLISLLRDWLIGHINQEDAKLTEFLQLQAH